MNSEQPKRRAGCMPKCPGLNGPARRRGLIDRTPWSILTMSNGEESRQREERRDLMMFRSSRLTYQIFWKPVGAVDRGRSC